MILMKSFSRTDIDIDCYLEKLQLTFIGPRMWICTQVNHKKSYFIKIFEKECFQELS